MNKLRVLLMASLLLSGCASKKEEANSGSQVAAGNEELVPADTTSQTKGSIIGPWGISDSENAVFSIDDDSIYYVDSDKIFKYVVSQDSIHIFFDDFKYSALVEKRTNDTLIFTDKRRRTKFIRFKD